MQIDPLQEDTTNSSLAKALREDKHVLIHFHSAACNLCKSISAVVDKEHRERRQWLNVASVCTDGAQGCAPEMLTYDVKAVPCFVLLKPGGHAVAKSGKPRSKAHVTAALEELLQLATPQPCQQHN